jgi:hypothetical protein
MNINVSINFTAGDEGYEYTADETAQRILDAVGGDPEKDMISITMNASAQIGAMASAPLPVPPLETPAAPDESDA